MSAIKLLAEIWSDERVLLYTDTLKGHQICRDDMWAITTAELESLRALLKTGGWEPAELAMHEVARAVAKFPTWPTDPLHAVTVLGEEFGELTKAALQLTYEPHKTSMDEFRTEAIQTAAMALRFLQSIDAYQFKRGEQHTQQPLPPLPDEKE